MTSYDKIKEFPLQYQEAFSQLNSITDYMRWIYSYLSASDAFYGHGYTNALDEARNLILDALDLPLDIPSELYSAKLINAEKLAILNLVYERIGNRIPLAYLINKAWFCDLEFYVDERVIIPRSPIAELIKNHFQDLISLEPRRILDMCTGSACIAIACAKEFPKAEIDAVDISLDALNVAEINIQAYMLEDRVFPLQSDLFNALAPIEYDLIVANPPYVDQEDLDCMPDEFHCEPALALGSGIDGLDITKQILANAAEYLTDDGILICEVGNSMLSLIEQFPKVPFNWIKMQHGGIGIFGLTKKQLIKHSAEFKLDESN